MKFWRDPLFSTEFPDVLFKGCPAHEPKEDVPILIDLRILIERGTSAVLCDGKLYRIVATELDIDSVNPRAPASTEAPSPLNPNTERAAS